MNFSTANPFVFGEPNLPHPIPPYVAQQAYGSYANQLALNDSVSQMQALDMQFITDQSGINPSRAFGIHTPHNAESFGDTQTIPAIPMGPPPKSRKRKAPTLRAEDWEPHKTRILELHITQKLPLREVKEKIEEEFEFSAEIRQYRTRISQWGKDKNVKPVEMKAIVRRRQQRKLVEVDKEELKFTVRGNTVESQKIDRWMSRHGVPESLPYAPSPAASTPSAVCCRTVSERGSLAPSPAYSAQTPNFSPEGIMSVVQSPAAFSPALSQWSMAQPQSSTFVGQSPAPMYQSLPRLLSGSPTTPSAFHDQLDTETGSLQYRYRQIDEKRLRKELSVVETLFGTSHSKTLDILFELGDVLIDQGRYKSAEEMVRKLVEGLRSSEGNDSIKILDAMELLGRVLICQGFYGKAEKLHRRVFESRKVTLGGENPSTLASMANIALTYGHQGRWKEAEELQVQLVEIGKRVLGEEHPETLVSMGNLALTYRNQGRWKEAEKLQVPVLEIIKKVLGNEHPNTPISMGHLALTYMHQGRWKEAEELRVLALKILKKVLGNEHPDTLISMGNLALTYMHQERWKEAEELEVPVLEIRKRVIGEEHPDTLYSMGNLATIYRNQGRWKEAEELEVPVLKMLKRVLGEEHPDTLVGMGNLALTYVDQGRWKEAEELEVPVLEIRKRVIGEEHPDTLVSMGNLAIIYRNQGRWKEAEELEEEVVEIRKESSREENI